MSGRKNIYALDLRTSKYRKRVTKNKKAYDRKQEKKSSAKFN